MDSEDSSDAYPDTSVEEPEIDLDGPSVDFGTVTLPDEGDDGSGEELDFEPEPDSDFVDP